MGENYKYIVVKSYGRSSFYDTLDALEREVQQALSMGAILQGGVSISVCYEGEGDAAFFYAAQALISN